MKAGWKTVKLGDIALVGAGNSAPQDDADFSTDGPCFVRTSDVGEVKFGTVNSSNDRLSSKGAKGMRLWKAGTILIPKSGASTFVNHRVILGLDAHVSSHLATIQAEPTRCDARYLLYYLSTVKAQDLIQDQSYPSLKLPEIAGIEIPLPPLAEQKRIVALLDEAFAGIDEAMAKAEDSITQLKELSDSSSEVVVNKETQNLTFRPLRDMCEGVFTGPFGTILHKHDYITGGIPLVNPAHINDEGITPGQSKTVSRETAQRLKSYLLKKGDVVIGRRGEMGRCAEITDIEDGWLCGTGSFFIRLYPTCNPKYLVILLKSRSVREKLNGMAKGATIANLGSNDLADLELPFPSIEIQQNIVSRVDALNHEIRALDYSLTKRAVSMDTLKSSILAQAFAGELNA